MKRLFVGLLALGLLTLSITGCGTRHELSGSGEDGPAGSGNSPATAAVDPTGAGAIDPTAEPSEVRRFLGEQQIANGDIYLKDGKVYINIVGLNEAIGRLLADRYRAGTYQTVDVAHTLDELLAAQQKLTDNDLYRQLNLYGSDVDVIRNKLTVNMPDSSEAEAKEKLEQLIDPDMLSYAIQKMSEKGDYVGTIAAIDAERHRILLLVDGEREPSIYFGFDEHSEMVGADGSKLTFNDLKEKQRVRMWSTGAIDDSMPAQAVARKLELLVQTERQEQQ